MRTQLLTYEARQRKDNPCIWEVWETTHPDEIQVATIDSHGAADDFHEEWAKDIAAFLNLCKRKVIICE